MPLEPVHSAAPDVRVQADDDEAFSLAGTWRDQAAVLIFLRHFG